MNFRQAEIEENHYGKQNYRKKIRGKRSSSYDPHLE